MSRLLLTLLVVIVTLTCAVLTSDCGNCERSRCVRLRKCPAGIILDRCGCCQICALGLDTPCKNVNVPSNDKLGRCGENLDCRVREDLKSDKLEATCQCKHRDELCGTDGHTYPSQCHIDRALFEKGKNIKVLHAGPCEYAPVIRTPPRNSVNNTGDYNAFSCEVRGHPIPVITWTWKSAGEQKKVELPNDDLDISVSVRGGPEKYQKTGWLQVTNIQEKHEGDFVCHATNRRGHAMASARLKVINKGKYQKRKFKKQRRQSKN